MYCTGFSYYLYHCLFFLFLPFILPLTPLCMCSFCVLLYLYFLVVHLFVYSYLCSFLASLLPFFVHSFRCSLVLLLYHCVHSRVFSFLHSSVPVFLVFLILYVLNSGLLGQYSSVSTIGGPIEAHYSVTLLFLGQNGAKKKIFQRSLGSPPI